MTRLDLFFMMFPPDQLNALVELTSRELEVTKKTATTKGEMLKFLGILILATRHKFGKRRDLWKKS